jgi:prophage regulatory protein
MPRRRQENPREDAGRLPEHGFVRLPTILAVFPVSRSTWWSGVRSGKYPAATKLGPGLTAWPVEAIRSLLDSYLAPGSDSPRRVVRAPARAKPDTGGSE